MSHTMKSDMCYVANEGHAIEGSPTEKPSLIFEDSQFFWAPDGSVIMVDWIETSGTWYVTTQEA